jgi:hypothetical protein
VCPVDDKPKSQVTNNISQLRAHGAPHTQLLALTCTAKTCSRTHHVNVESDRPRVSVTGGYFRTLLSNKFSINVLAWGCISVFPTVITPPFIIPAFSVMMVYGTVVVPGDLVQYPRSRCSVSTGQ